MAPYAGVPAYSTGGQPQQRWDGGVSMSQGESSGPFTSGIDAVCCTIAGDLGFVAVGVSAPHGQPACLRAWDVKNKRVLWETLQGLAWLDNIDASSLAIVGRNVYVANKRQLVCLDLMNGNKKWNAALSDSPESNDAGIAIADPFPQQGRGAILVPTIDHGLFAFDRDSGQPLWQRSYGDKSIEVAPVPDLGACLVRYGFPYVKVDVLNPAYAQPIASLGHDHWSTDLGLARLSGRTVLTVVDDMGPEGDDDGLFCFDGVTGQPHFFDRVEDLDNDDIVPCMMGPRAFAGMSSGEGIYVGPRGRPIPPPIPNHAVAAFCAAGPTLALLLKKSHGTPVRRIVGLDPNTLGFRFDAGEAGSEPDDDWDQQMITDGYSLVFVATPNDDEDQCELRSVDTTTGRMLWSRPVGSWRRHRFIQGQLVVWTRERIEVLAPQNGQVLATLSG